MRLTKIIFIIVCLTIFTIFLNTTVTAQTTYEQLLDNYRAALDVYKQELEKYQFARSEYLKYQTPVSKDSATAATKDFLNARQQVLITYLRVMKERLEQSPELTEEELRSKIIYINNEIEFLENKQPFFNAAKDLETLIKLSNDIKKRYATFNNQAFQMKGLIIISKVRSLLKTGRELVTLTSEQVARIKKEGEIDTIDMERWLLDAPRILILAEEKEKAAVNNFNRHSANAKTYGGLQTNLNKVIQNLKEINQLLLDIVRDIRYD